MLQVHNVSYVLWRFANMLIIIIIIIIIIIFIIKHTVKTCFIQT